MYVCVASFILDLRLRTSARNVAADWPSCSPTMVAKATSSLSRYRCTSWNPPPSSSGLKGAAAVWLEYSFVPEAFSAWSHLSQLALLSFTLAVVTLAVLLLRRYTAVESGLLWALLASWIALAVGGGTVRADLFFAAAGATLFVALLETSYKMAYHDELTQLPSRRALNEALMKLPESYTIAMIDVDHFKKFNDSYGHEAGDQALRLVASRLAHVAGGGRAYRYGGEEFAVVFAGKPPEDVVVYLDRMRRIIEQSTFVVRGKDRRKSRGGKPRRGNDTAFFKKRHREEVERKQDRHDVAENMRAACGKARPDEGDGGLRQD